MAHQHPHFRFKVGINFSHAIALYIIHQGEMQIVNPTDGTNLENIGRYFRWFADAQQP
jgi:hypothetical protein